MLPMKCNLNVKYELVGGRYEIVHDARKWNPAHYEAVHNPCCIHEILLGYKEQHGESPDINGAGPGGFTPLMLAVMKHNSSNENIVYNHDCADFINSTAADGRPVSNGSLLIHDGDFYPDTSFIPPVESSVTTLLKTKIDVNAVNDFGQTAIQLAAACSQTMLNSCLRQEPTQTSPITGVKVHYRLP